MMRIMLAAIGLNIALLNIDLISSFSFLASFGLVKEVTINANDRSKRQTAIILGKNAGPV